MDFWLILYLVVTLVVGSGVISYLYKQGKTIGAMLLLVLLILVFTFYGLRWFPGGNLNGSNPSGNVTWPPIVNMCPDFMVGWTDSANGNKVYCYDASNTYGLKSYSGAGLTPGLTINNLPSQSAYLILDPSQHTNATSLRDDSDGKRWPFLYLLKTNPNLILSDTNGKYLRWEGVLDGSTIAPEKAPLP